MFYWIKSSNKQSVATIKLQQTLLHRTLLALSHHIQINSTASERAAWQNSKAPWIIMIRLCESWIVITQSSSIIDVWYWHIVYGSRLSRLW